MNGEMHMRERVNDGNYPFGHRCAVVAVVCAFVLFVGGCRDRQANGPTAMPPMKVLVADVIRKDVQITSEWVGTAEGFIDATIRAQVTGYLIRRNYEEGDFVKKGQILFQIDPRTFVAALEKAKGQLAQQNATWENARSNLGRIKALAAQKAVSQKDLDDATGQEQASHGAMIAAQAAVDQAQLELDFTKIVSPIDGIAGIATAQVGDLVGPGQTGLLTTVSQVNPIKIAFFLSEQEYLKVSAGAREIKERPLEIILADGTVYPHKAKFSSVDRQVNVRTGTIRVEALADNPGNVLRPGQFVRVRAVTQTKKNALLVPQRAVSELQGSYEVAVVGTDNKVDIRPVKMGERLESLWVVEEGIKPGERVIVEGIQKVRQGMTVAPEPFHDEKRNGLSPASPPTTDRSKEAR